MIAPDHFAAAGELDQIDPGGNASAEPAQSAAVGAQQVFDLPHAEQEIANRTEAGGVAEEDHAAVALELEVRAESIASVAAAN